MKDYTIVQFHHTGKEAIPIDNSNRMGWNNNVNHARKFIKSNGNFIDNSGKLVEEKDLTFWGEWEAQSNFERLKNNKRRYPKFLHKPFLDPSKPEMLHNTDPYVFGYAFRYIICLQPSFYKKLTNLKENSIILFGSSIDKRFCLDTLFVVSHKFKNYNFKNVEKLFGKDKGQYYYASVNPLCGKLRGKIADEVASCGSKAQIQDYTYYEGVNFNNKNDYQGVYSYAPAKIYDNKESKYIFKQPELDLDFLIPTQTQSINTKECSLNEIVDYWHLISEQISGKNLHKGVQFKSPMLLR